MNRNNEKEKEETFECNIRDEERIILTQQNQASNPLTKKNNLAKNKIFKFDELVAKLESFPLNVNNAVSILVSGLITFVLGIHILYYGVLMSSIRKFYHISNETNYLLKSTVYFGVAVGALMSGFLTKWLSRKNIILFSLGGILFTDAMLIFFSENINAFIVNRLKIGLFSGVLIPQFLANLTEVLPKHLRAFILLFMFVFLNISGIYTSCMSLIKFSEESSKVNVFFIILTHPTILVFLFVFIFYKDSFRYEFINGNYDAGYLMIRSWKIDLSLGELGLSDEQSLKKALADVIVKRNDNVSIEKELRYIFSDKYRKTTTILVLLSSFFAFILNGRESINQMVEIKSIQNTGEGPYDKLKANVLNHVISIFGSVFAGYLCDLPFIGRKRTMMIGLVMLFLMFLSDFTLTEKNENNYRFTNYFIPLCLPIIPYIAEIYPTKIRDLAIGIFGFLHSMWVFLLHFIIVKLDEISVDLPSIILLGLIAVSFALISMLEKETMDSVMDTVVSNEDSYAHAQKRDT